LRLTRALLICKKELAVFDFSAVKVVLVLVFAVFCGVWLYTNVWPYFAQATADEWFDAKVIGGIGSVFFVYRRLNAY